MTWKRVCKQAWRRERAYVFTGFLFIFCSYFREFLKIFKDLWILQGPSLPSAVCRVSISFFFLVYLLRVLQTIRMPTWCFKWGCKYPLDTISKNLLLKGRKASATFRWTICYFAKRGANFCLQGRAVLLQRWTRPRRVCAPHRRCAWRQRAGGTSLPEVLIHCSDRRGCLVAKLGGRETRQRGGHLDQCK